MKMKIKLEKKLGLGKSDHKLESLENASFILAEILSWQEREEEGASAGVGRGGD